MKVIRVEVVVVVVVVGLELVPEHYLGRVELVQCQVATLGPVL